MFNKKNYLKKKKKKKIFFLLIIFFFSSFFFFLLLLFFFSSQHILNSVLLSCKDGNGINQSKRRFQYDFSIWYFRLLNQPQNEFWNQLRCFSANTQRQACPFRSSLHTRTTQCSRKACQSMKSEDIEYTEE